MPKRLPKANQQAVTSTEPLGEVDCEQVVASTEPSGEVEADDLMLSDYPMNDRQNADKIVGRHALVQLGQQYGMLVCQMMAWPMDKLRQQIKYAQTSRVTNEWNALQESAP